MSQIGTPVIPFWSLAKKSPAAQSPKSTNPVVASVKKPIIPSDVIHDITRKTTPVEKNAFHKPPATMISSNPLHHFPQEPDKNEAHNFDPEELIKKLTEKRNLTAQMMQLFSNSPSLCDETGSCIDEFAERIKQMDGAIATINQASELLNLPVNIPNQASKVIELQYDDIPKCLFVGQSNSQFRNAKWYNNIREFVNTFENVIASSNQDLELVWKQYIQMSFSKELKQWANTCLMICESWNAAKQILYSKFGSASSRLLARRKLMSIKMEKDEDLDSYTARFTEAVLLAGYSIDDQTMSDTYFFGLPDSWQSRINNYLLIRMENTHWKLDDVMRAVTIVYGKIPYNQYNKGFQESNGKGKRKIPDTQAQATKKSKKAIYIPKKRNSKSNSVLFDNLTTI